MAADAAIAEHDAIADLMMADVRADGLNDARAIASKDGGHVIGVVGAACAQLGINGIDPRGMQFDPQLSAGRYGWIRNLTQRELIRVAGWITARP